MSILYAHWHLAICGQMNAFRAADDGGFSFKIACTSIGASAYCPCSRIIAEQLFVEISGYVFHVTINVNLSWRKTEMDQNSIIMILIVGGIAGWLAGVIMKGDGLGLIGNIVIGVVGAFVGSYTFELLGVSIIGGLIGSIITATVGAVILLFIVGLVKKS